MEKIYHISFKEKYMPKGVDFHETNRLMRSMGIEVSAKYRSVGVQFGTSYLCLFTDDDGKPKFSRVDKRHYDAFDVFKDGHEMRECSCFEEFKRKTAEFALKGYIETDE